MAFWMDLLFGSWIGLLSMLTIFFIIGMGVFFVWFFLSRSAQPPDDGDTRPAGRP